MSTRATCPPQSPARRRALVLGLTGSAWAALGDRALAEAPQPAAAPPAPPEVAALWPAPHRQGEALFRYFGLSIYRIALWAPRPLPVGGSWDRPLALSLHYTRDLVGRRIAERSLDEMRGLGEVSDAEAALWLERMSAVFPDVRDGQRLTGIHRPGQGARFFHEGQPVGDIAGARFAHLFFGIWLSPDTSAPELRRRLLGAAT